MMAQDRVRLIIRAYDEHGYSRDILIQDAQQVWMQDSRLAQGHQGLVIIPSALPEMVKFEVILEPWR